jgi:hypothetical protein
MTTETRDANERLALLLGWKWWVHKSDLASAHPGRRFLSEGDISWFAVPAAGAEPVYERYQDDTPDYTQWDRYPEMAGYVRGLSDRDANRVLDAVEEMLVEQGYGDYMLLYITPTILRDAILAVLS